MLRHLLLITIILIFTGCGGNKRDILENDKDNNGEKDKIEMISGGTLDKPVYFKLGSKNEIKSNYFHNYFKYTAYTGEKLILHSTLYQDFQSADWLKCGSSGEIGSNNDVNFIRIYDNSLNLIKTSKRCKLDLTIEFPFSGTYILYFQYSKHNGYVEATSVSTEWVNSLPKLNLLTENEFFLNTFNNYYTYEADGNENLILHTILDQDFQSIDWMKCNSSGGLGSTNEINFIRVYDKDLNIIKTSKRCGLDLAIDFPMTRKYIIHFYYPKHSGYAEARAIN